MRSDFVLEVVALARETAGLDDRTAREMEARLRHAHGGRTVKIAERAPVTLAYIDAQLRERKTVRMIAGDAGVSRATIYRIIGAKGFKKRKHCDTPAL